MKFKIQLKYNITKTLTDITKHGNSCIIK